MDKIKIMLCEDSKELLKSLENFFASEKEMEVVFLFCKSSHVAVIPMQRRQHYEKTEWICGESAIQSGNGGEECG